MHPYNLIQSKKVNCPTPLAKFLPSSPMESSCHPTLWKVHAILPYGKFLPSSLWKVLCAPEVGLKIYSEILDIHIS